MRKMIIEDLTKTKNNTFDIQKYKEKYQAMVKKIDTDIETKIIIERLLDDLVEYSGSASLCRLKGNYTKAIKNQADTYIECLKDNTLCLFMEIACFTHDEVIREYFKKHPVCVFVKKYSLTDLVLKALL